MTGDTPIPTDAIAMLIPVEALSPHPLNELIYEEESVDPRLVASIASLGIVEPLLVEEYRPGELEDGSYQILSGHRRWRAAIAAGLAEVPCRVIPRLDDDLAKAEVLIEANRQRDKTLSQRMNEARELECIEKEKAKRRQGTRTDIVEKLPQGEAGKTRDKVAAHIGMSGRTYDKAKTIFEKAGDGDEVAQEQVEKLDKGETSISRAFNEVQQKKTEPWHDLQVDYRLTDAGMYQSRTLHFGGRTEIEAMKAAWDRFRQDLGEDTVLECLTLDGETDIPIEEFLQIVGAPTEEYRRLVDAPAAEEKAHPQASPAIIIDDPEAKRHTIGIWYQSPTMEKPEYTRHQGALTPDIIGGIYPGDRGAAARAMQWMAAGKKEGYTFSRIRFNKVDIGPDDLKILALWGRIPEEEVHTITVHFMNGKLPAVAFFDGVPQAAAQKALDWLAGYSGWLAGYDGKIRRIHYCDGAGSSMDISTTGLGYLAKIEGAPKKRPGKISKATAQYLTDLRDEIEAMLQFDKREYDNVRVEGRTIVVEVPGVEGE